MEHLRISRLEVSGIGPFGHLELDFPEKPAGMEDKAEVHILTGENGTGKTTVLELLALSLSNALEVSFSKVRATENQRSFRVDYDSQPLDFQFDRLRFRMHGKRVSAIENYWQSFHNYQNSQFSTAFFAYSGYRRVQHFEITGIQELTDHPFSEVLNFANSINPRIILQWLANTVSKEAIERWQGTQAKAERYRQAITSLEASLASIIGNPIKFHLDTEPFKVKVELDGEMLDFNALPDGLKSIISWIADLLMRMDRVKWENDTPVFERNFILFLDEIEVHMHPAWQRKILPAVQKLFPNAQIFISTHSPFVVGSVDGAWIHKLVKPNGDSKLAEGYPKPSEDAKSYRYWLDEVFDLRSEYGMEAENELKRFYELRDSVLKGANGSEQKSLLQVGKKLAEQSDELRQIIEMELRQVNRRQSLQLSL